MKTKETIEEVAKKYVEQITIAEFGKPHKAPHRIKSFIDGAKWQAEQDKKKYSEEDLRKAYFSGISSTAEGWNGEYADGNDPNIEEKFSEGFTKWFDQLKKKRNN
jgi:hypothetical protein